MAEENKTPKVKAPARPNPQATEKNTPQTTLPQNPDPETRVDENVQMVVQRTGQLVGDVEGLVAETRDQLVAEAKAGEYREDPKLDTLALEQLDHQRTLERALGIGEADDSEKLMQAAMKRAEGLKDKKRDTSKDNVLNSIPANWRVTTNKDGSISAVNVVTNKTFEGDPKDLFKTPDADA